MESVYRSHTELVFKSERCKLQPKELGFATLNGQYRQVKVVELFPAYAIVQAPVPNSYSGRSIRRAVRWSELDIEPTREALMIADIAPDFLTPKSRRSKT